ncbi:hypothetical protein C0Q70_06185 [Pomacea canaliculata]|uniref:Uncharacterized protein n=1 Tax=Pomacea canaliculata TaxID=400727 RepID=A0A2T7PNA5_POMCA|nr:hypothetical protein C0Q70_06185 [Pomacea canaliculata]
MRSSEDLVDPISPVTPLPASQPPRHVLSAVSESQIAVRPHYTFWHLSSQLITPVRLSTSIFQIHVSLIHSSHVLLAAIKSRGHLPNLIEAHSSKQDALHPNLLLDADARQMSFIRSRASFSKNTHLTENSFRYSRIQQRNLVSSAARQIQKSDGNEAEGACP